MKHTFKNTLIFLLLSPAFFATQSFAQFDNADWGATGKYKDISPADKDVIFNYAASKTEFFNALAQKQKTALQKLSSEILIKEDLLPGIDWTQVVSSVALKAGAGYIDNIFQKELGSIPIAGAIMDVAIDTYKDEQQRIEQNKRITDKNALAEVFNELGEGIDNIYQTNFSWIVKNKIAEDYFPLNLTDQGTEYLKKLEDATNNYSSSLPSSDDIYLSMIENLLNFLNSQNSKYGLVRIGIDFRNVPPIETALITDYDRAPAKVSIRINEGPYKSRITAIVNKYADNHPSFSVLNLKVNKYITCHLRAGSNAADGTVKLGTVNTALQFIPAFNDANPDIVIDSYYSGGDAHSDPFWTIATLHYLATNRSGVPATTTYFDIVNAIYSNVKINDMLYRKFTQ